MPKRARSAVRASALAFVSASRLACSISNAMRSVSRCSNSAWVSGISVILPVVQLISIRVSIVLLCFEDSIK